MAALFQAVRPCTAVEKALDRQRLQRFPNLALNGGGDGVRPNCRRANQNKHPRRLIQLSKKRARRMPTVSSELSASFQDRGKC